MKKNKTKYIILSLLILLIIVVIIILIDYFINSNKIDDDKYDEVIKTSVNEYLKDVNYYNNCKNSYHITTTFLYEKKYISKKIYQYQGEKKIAIYVDCSNKKVEDIEYDTGENTGLLIGEDYLEIIMEVSSKYFKEHNDLESCTEEIQLKVALNELIEYNSEKITPDIVEIIGEDTIFYFNYNCSMGFLEYISNDFNITGSLSSSIGED